MGRRMEDQSRHVTRPTLYDAIVMSHPAPPQSTTLLAPPVIACCCATTGCKCTPAPELPSSASPDRITAQIHSTTSLVRLHQSPPLPCTSPVAGRYIGRQWAPPGRRWLWPPGAGALRSRGEGACRHPGPPAWPEGREMERGRRTGLGMLLRREVREGGQYRDGGQDKVTHAGKVTA